MVNVTICFVPLYLAKLITNLFLPSGEYWGQARANVCKCLSTFSIIVIIVIVCFYSYLFTSLVCVCLFVVFLVLWAGGHPLTDFPWVFNEHEWKLHYAVTFWGQNIHLRIKWDQDIQWESWKSYCQFFFETPCTFSISKNVEGGRSMIG